MQITVGRELYSLSTFLLRKNLGAASEVAPKFGEVWFNPCDRVALLQY